jgi:hypothetical protein
MRKNGLPDRSNANFGALRISKETLEQFEEALKMLLETLDNSLQHGEQDVDANFAVGGLRGCCSLVQKWKKLGPSAYRYLDARDRSNNTGSGVADKSTR